MNMIGHDAVGADCKAPSRGFRAEDLEKPTTGCCVGEYLAAVVATQGHKIELATYVAAMRETNILVKVHDGDLLDASRIIIQISDGCVILKCARLRRRPLQRQEHG
jgi:hypothetical protein